MQVTYVSQTNSKMNQSTSNTSCISGAFEQIIEKKHSSELDTKSFLSSLSPQELYEVQKSNHLAANINIQSLSEEGAQNLFIMPVDKYETVDLNHDGIIEVGAAKNFVFPPPNSPDNVINSWKEVCKNSTFKEQALVEGRFLAMQLEANSYQKSNGDWSIHEPGEDGWVNIFGDSSSRTMHMLCNKIIFRIDHPLITPSEQQQKNDACVKRILTEFMDGF